MIPEIRTVTLLGFTLPDSVYKEQLAGDQGMAVQTHKFAWSVVNSLLSAGLAVNLLSAVPSSNFPRSPRVYFHGGEFRVGMTVGKILPFVNVALLKHITRLISCLFVGSIAMARRRTDVLLIHGVHSPYLWYGVLVRLFTRIRVVPILTDPPGVVQSYDSKLIKFLKSVDVWLVKRALGWCDGVVALSPYLGSDFAAGKPSLVIDGIWSGSAAPTRSEPRIDGVFEIVYAGGLTLEYGVDRLVEAVAALPRRDVRLSLYGKGDLESWIRKFAHEDARISEPIFVDSNTLAAKYASADVLVNPRPVDQSFVRYSFPSKIIEYMATGKPVITTRLPTISMDYEGCVIFAENDSVAGLSDALCQAMELSSKEKEALVGSATEFIRKSRSSFAQGMKIREFLNQLAARRAMS